MKPIKKFQLGKKGLTENFINQIKKCFKDKEIIKIEILKSCCRNKEEAGEIGKQLINSLGNNFTYKLIGYVLTIRKWRKPKT